MKDDLERFELLCELGGEERRGLAEFLRETEVDAGDVLFQAGEEAEDMYFLVHGALRIETGGRVLGYLNAGEVLGVVSLIQISRRECDAIAQEPSRLLVLSREGYMRLRADLPTVALALQEGILRSFAGHVRVVLADRRASSSSPFLTSSTVPTTLRRHFHTGGRRCNRPRSKKA